VGNIHAGNDEYEGDGAEQDQERAPNGRCGLIGNRDGVHRDLTLATGELGVQTLAERGELRVGGSTRHTVTQARHRREVERPAVLEIILAEGERRPYVGAHRELEPAREFGAARKGEAARCDADDREALATE